MLNKTNFTTHYTSIQTRTGNGQFSTSHRVATPAERNAIHKRAVVANVAPAKQAQLKALGLDDVEYSDIFAV